MGFSLKKLGKIVGGVLGGPVGAAIGSVAGGLVSGKKAKKAAGVQSGSQEAAIAEQRAALARAEGYQQPYRDAGTGALNSLNALNAGDYSGFENSPDMLAALKFGSQARERSAAARGGLNSGNTLIGLERFGQDNAAQYLGNYRNSLFQTAGMGQNAANALTSATLGTGQSIGNNLVGVGDARASGIAAGANATTNTIDQLAGLAGDYFGSKLVKMKPRPTAGSNSLYGYNIATPGKSVKGAA